MTIEELNKVASVSSGTVARFLGSNKYADMDALWKWAYHPLFDDMVTASVINYGENELEGLKHLTTIYKRWRKKPHIF